MVALCCKQTLGRSASSSRLGSRGAHLYCFAAVKARDKSSILGIVVFLFAFCVAGLAQDGGIPDSAYTLSPQFTRADCLEQLLIKVPVYYYGDQYHADGHFGFTWPSGIECDTIIALGRWQQSADFTSIVINRDDRVGRILVSTFGTNYFSAGSGVVAEIWMRAALSDTLTAEFFTGYPSGFWLQNIQGTWSPTYQDLTISIQAPDMIPEIYGDADCSAAVSVSDVVFLIAYIFSNGPDPVSINMADPNRDCLVTVSDVVFLINYIFAGGDAPSQGCIE